MGLKLRVAIESDKSTEHWLDLGAGRMVLGRTGSPLALGDPWCSKRHAVFFEGPDGTAYIADLQSRNGTFVNGYGVRNCSLSPGDEIRVGRTRITVLEVKMEGLGPDTILMSTPDPEPTQSGIRLEIEETLPSRRSELLGRDSKWAAAVPVPPHRRPSESSITPARRALRDRVRAFLAP